MGGGIKGGLKGGVTKVTGLTKLSHSHTTPFGTWLMGNAMGVGGNSLGKWRDAMNGQV